MKAKTNFKNEDYIQSLFLIEQLLEQVEGNLEIQKFYVHCLIKNGKIEKAESTLFEIMKEDKVKSDAHYFNGLIEY